MDNSDLRSTTSLTEQIAFVRNLDTEPVSNVPYRMDVKEHSWDFEVMATSMDVATSGICGKLQNVQCIFKDGGKAASKTVVKETEFARDVIEAKRETTTQTNQNTISKPKIVETCHVSGTMREQLTRAECPIVALKTQLGRAQLKFNKSTDESPRTKGDL